MATDVRGHTVPAAEDPPARADLTRLSLSVPSIKVVADATARAQYITDLAAEPVPIIPSTSNPVYVFRSDAASGAEIEYTVNGSAWRTISATGRTAYAMAAGVKAGSMSSDTSVSVSETFPAGRFTVAPVVTADLIGGAGGLSTLRVGIQSVSSSGVTFIVNSVTGSAVTVSLSIGWQAVQMTSTTAAG